MAAAALNVTRQCVSESLIKMCIWFKNLQNIGLARHELTERQHRNGFICIEL